MTAPTIDRATFDELKETAGAEFVVELVDTFLVEGPDDARLTCAGSLAAQDADRFRRAAHSLKSNSNTFGALGLAGDGEGARADRTRPRRSQTNGAHARRARAGVRAGAARL
jgi:HPt (histidine-containing phosphotransfer) domain-containing protein